MEILKKIKFQKAKPYQGCCAKCIIEEKIDGIRILLVQGFALTRGYNNLWDELPEHLQRMANDIPVDGELHWPGHPSTDVISGLKSKSGELHFTGFYLPLFSGQPLEHREKIKEMGINVPRLYGNDSYITLPPIKVLKEAARRQKIEGWIVKEQYKTKWWKIKLIKTYDLVVTGYNIATEGKYEGMLKSLKCSAYIKGKLVELANVSGLNETEREDFEPEKDVGRVVEVQAQFRAAQGRLRNPIFIRWRDDKPAKECVLDAA